MSCGYPTLDITCLKKTHPPDSRDIGMYRDVWGKCCRDSFWFDKVPHQVFLLGLGFYHSGTRGYHKSIQLFNIDIFTPQKSNHRYQKWPYFQPESHLFPRPTILGYLCQFFADVCIYIYINVYIYIYLRSKIHSQWSGRTQDQLITNSPNPPCETWSFTIRVFRVRTFPQQQGGTLLSVSYGTWIWAKYSDQPGQLLVHHVIVLWIFFPKCPSFKRQGRCRKHTREKKTLHSGFRK